MNEVAISEQKPTFSRDGLRTVKVTTLRDAAENEEFFAEIHDEKGIIRRVVGPAIFSTNNPVKSWTGEDHVIVPIEGRGPVRFQNHTMGGPKYPIAKIVGPHGRPRNVRVTFFTPVTVAPVDKEQPAAPVVEETGGSHNVTLAIAPPVMEEPVSDDTPMDNAQETPEMTDLLAPLTEGGQPEEIHEEEPEVGVLTLADFPKPKMEDYENQGAWLTACKKRKAAMREVGLKD